MSYKAHNRILLSTSLLFILVSFTITITQGAEHSAVSTVITAGDCSDRSARTVDMAAIDQACSDDLSTPEFLTILMVGLGLTGIGFAVRRLYNGYSPH